MKTRNFPPYYNYIHPNMGSSNGPYGAPFGMQNDMPRAAFAGFNSARAFGIFLTAPDTSLPLSTQEPSVVLAMLSSFMTSIFDAKSFDPSIPHPMGSERAVCSIELTALDVESLIKDYYNMLTYILAVVAEIEKRYVVRKSWQDWLTQILADAAERFAELAEPKPANGQRMYSVELQIVQLIPPRGIAGPDVSDLVEITVSANQHVSNGFSPIPVDIGLVSLSGAFARIPDKAE